MAFSRTKILTFYLTYILLYSSLTFYLAFYLTYKHIHTFRPTICRSQFWVVSHASLQVKEISLSDFSLDVHVNGLVEGKFCRTPPHIIYIYISNIYIYIYIYIYIWWENQWFPVKIFPKKNKPLTKNQVSHSTPVPTLGTSAQWSHPAELALVGALGALGVFSLGIRGIRPRVTVSFLLFDFEAYHVGSMLDHCKFCPLFVMFDSSLDYPQSQYHMFQTCFEALRAMVLEIKGPDNPTSQLLPIISMKACRRDGERRLGKGGGEGSRS